MKNIYIFLLALLSGVVSINFLNETNAASAADWNAGNIISDAQFMDGRGMTTDEIQALLAKLLPACDVWGMKPSELGGGTRAQYAASAGNPAPFTCLTGYYEVPKTSPGNYIPVNNYGQYNANGSPYIPPGSKSAAQLISDAAIRYSISPKALVIKLATESAGPLTKDEWPLKKQYYYAMGAHCPDSGPGGAANCDVNYAGFSMQIAESAKLLRGYIDGMTQSWWPYKKPYQTNQILWNVVERRCGSSPVYIESKATAALYTYTPYQPNQAALNNLYGTGDYCSAYGNRNFWRVWVDWFGSTQADTSRLFRSTSSSQVFTLIDGFKVAVPSMAVLQDYGFDPGSVAALSDSYVNSIPAPTASSRISPSLGYVVKSTSDTDSDGGAAYLVSRGKKYTIQSMAQFYSYGLKESEISYLPLAQVQFLSGSGNLTEYAQMPDGAINLVTGATKQLVLDYPTFVSLNPSGSHTPLSEGALEHLRTSNPLTSTFAPIKKSGDPAVYLYTNGRYDLVPSMNTYSCMGIGSTSALQLVELPSSRLPHSITPEATANCLAVNNQKSYVVQRDEYYTVPDTLKIRSTYQMPDAILHAIKDRRYSGEVSQYVKSHLPTIWRLKDGHKQAVPTYQNFVYLGSPSFSVIDEQILAQINEGGISLGDGTIVKSNTSLTIYAINRGLRYSIPSVHIFNSYGFSWNKIEEYQDQTLATIPVADNPISELLKDGDNLYLIENGSCKLFSKNLITELDLSVIQTQYNKDVSKNIDFNKCGAVSRYIKYASSATVYKIELGSIRPISSWSTLIKDAGTSTPSITTLPSQLLEKIPLGQPIQ